MPFCDRRLRTAMIYQQYLRLFFNLFSVLLLRIEREFGVRKVDYKKLNSKPRKDYPFFSQSRRRLEAVISSDKVKISTIPKTGDMSDRPGGEMVLAFQLVGRLS
jgi:hypothetical protein